MLVVFHSRPLRSSASETVRLIAKMQNFHSFLLGLLLSILVQPVHFSILGIHKYMWKMSLWKWHTIRWLALRPSWSRIPFIPFLVCSSTPTIWNSIPAPTSTKKMYYIVYKLATRLAKEGDYRSKGAWIHCFLSIWVRIISPRKGMRLSKNHTFKYSSMTCIALTFSNSRGSFSIKWKGGWLQGKTVTSYTFPPSALIFESKMGRRFNASFPTS